MNAVAEPVSTTTRVVPLAEAVELNPRPDRGSLPDDLDVSFVPMAAVEAATGRMDTAAVRRYGEVKKGYTVFREGDVLFAKITPCMENGKMAVARGLHNGVGCGSTEFHVLRPRPGVDPQYVYHFVSSARFRAEAAHHMTGAVGQKRVPGAFLEQCEIPVPALDEQRRIVAELEKQFSRLDEAVANLKRVKANLKRYEEATIRDVSVAAKRGSPIPTASELFSWSSGVNLPASKQHGGPVPVYGGNGITGYHSQGNISEATVVIGRVGAGCGNVHFVREPAWITDNAIYASRVADTIFLPYAALMFRAANLNSRAAGSGQPFVNQRMLNEVQMPLPSLDEQHRIVAEVDRRLSIVREVEAEVDANLKRAQALRQAVLAKAFGGEQ